MNRINKEYKTIDERINILKNRGLLFKNEKEAYKILLEHSYFDIINANEKLFADVSFSEKHYLPNIYFEDLYDIYLFNNELSELTMNMLLSVESKLKNSVAYRFSGRYCNTISTTEEYTNRNNFVRPHQRALQQKWDDFKPFNRRNFIPFLKHNYSYMNVYDKLPFWVATKGIVFGTMVLFVNFLDETTKQEVKKDLGLEGFSIDAFEFAIYYLKDVRNSCAHGDMIYRFSGTHDVSSINIIAGIQEFHLSRQAVNYMDILKILASFISKKEIVRIKNCILKFYIKYVFKNKTWMAKKILGKMGNQNIKKWMKL